MPLFKDGSQMKVGDIFMSPRSGTQYRWKITALHSNRVYWVTADNASITGSTAFEGLDYAWVLEAPYVRPKTGFSKFIRKIENNDSR